MLHWADRVAKVEGGLTEDTAIFLERSRALFVRACATLDDPNAADAARRQAFDTAIRAAFQIGELKGGVEQVLWGRKLWPRQRTRSASAGKTKIVEKRRAAILAISAKNKWPLDGIASYVIELRKKRRFKKVSRSTVGNDLKFLRTHGPTTP